MIPFERLHLFPNELNLKAATAYERQIDMLNSVKINDQAWEVQSNGKVIGRVLKIEDHKFNAWVGDDNRDLGEFPSKYAAKKAVKNKFKVKQCTL